MRARIKHTKSFNERLTGEAARCREATERLPPGAERDLLMKRADQAEKAAQISDWLTSPNTAPPALLAGLIKTT